MAEREVYWSKKVKQSSLSKKATSNKLVSAKRRQSISKYVKQRVVK